MHPPKVTLAVGGRFHSEFLAEAVQSLGYDCELWTSFPKNRFKENLQSKVHSLIFPELVFRLARKIGLENTGDIFKIQTFGKLLASSLEKQKNHSNGFICWSSFGLETLRKKPFSHTAIIRDSAHIAFQMEVLRNEYSLFGKKIPNREIIVEREEEEYKLADKIIVLSQFAKKTFLDRAIPEDKLQIFRLGVDTERFTPSGRKFTGGKLKAIYFGAISVRKGVHYLLEACQNLKSVELTLVGDVEEVLKPLLEKAIRSGVIYHKAMPQVEVANTVSQQDVFIMPTLEDGFGQTVVQAMAAGVVPISTDRCGASERIEHKVTGIRIPASSVLAIRNTLEELQASPEQVEKYRSHLLQNRQALSWDIYREDVSQLVKSHWLKTTMLSA